MLLLAAVAGGPGPALAAEGPADPIARGSVFEEPGPDAVFVGAFGGAYRFESGQGLGTSPLAGVRTGIWFEGGALGLEEYLLYSPAKGTSGAQDNQFFVLGAEFLYRFGPAKAVRPFAALGAGVAAFDPEVEGEARRSVVTAGGGVEWSLAGNLSLRGDARYLMTVSGTRRGNWMTSFGVGWTLGR